MKIITPSVSYLILGNGFEYIIIAWTLLVDL